MSESFFPDHSERPVEPLVERVEMLTRPEPGSLPPDEPPMTEEARLAAIMSYIPFLCFIPLVNINWRENEEARFHARQGIVLFLIELLAVVLLIDDLARFVFKCLLVGAVALSAVGIYFALQGRRYRLPIVSDVADKAKI